MSKNNHSHFKKYIVVFWVIVLLPFVAVAVFLFLVSKNIQELISADCSACFSKQFLHGRNLPAEEARSLSSLQRIFFTSFLKRSRSASCRRYRNGLLPSALNAIIQRKK